MFLSHNKLASALAAFTDQSNHIEHKDQALVVWNNWIKHLKRTARKRDEVVTWSGVFDNKTQTQVASLIPDDLNISMFDQIYINYRTC